MLQDLDRLGLYGLRILVILSILAVGMNPRPVFSQTRTWSPPLQLSNPAEESWFPDIAADDSGQVHVVWSATDHADTYDLVMYTRSQDGQTWSDANDIIALEHVPGNLYVTRPTFAANLHDQLALGVHGPGDAQYIAFAPLSASNNAASWSVTQLDGAGYHVVAAYDGDGGLHVIYTQSVPGSICMPCLQVFHAQFESASAGQSKPTNISEFTNLGAAKPQLLTDGQAALYAVWEAGADGDRGYVVDPAAVMYAASYDDGTSWSIPVRLAPAPEDDPARQARNIAIGMTGKGGLVVAWWSMPDNQVYYRPSDEQGRNWTPPQLIPGVWGIGTSSTTRQDDYAMVSDSSGNVHLVLVGRRTPDQADVALLHVVWNGASWSPAETIATYDCDLPEWPRLAIGLGNRLHVVWHVRPNRLSDQASELPPQVWYSTQLLDSPAVAAIMLPTPTVVPTAQTVSQQDAGTARPNPATPLSPETSREPQTVVSIQSLMTENDDVLLLAKSLVPVALLVGVTALALRRRRSRARQ